MTTDLSIKRELDERSKESQQLYQQWWHEANLDTKMYLGDQDNQSNIFPNYKNTSKLQFNKLMRVINMVSGHQRKSRNVMLATPVENSDNTTSDQLTACMFHATNQDGTYEKISDCFDGSNITGLNYLQVWMDFGEDPENGELRTSRVAYNEVLTDPYWKDPSLSDCEWIWRRRYLSKEQIVNLAPQVGDNIKDMQSHTSFGDGKFLYLPEQRQMYDSNNMFSYDEYWKRDYKTVEKFLDTKSGEVIDIPRNFTEVHIDAFMYSNPDVKLIKAKRKTVKWHVLVNDIVVWEEEDPYGINDLPFVPFMCYFTPEAENYSFRYQGLIRNSRDSQIELNVRRNKFFDIIDSQLNSGLIVKENALVDPEDAFLSGQGRALFLKDSASMADIQQIQAPQIPPSMFELSKMLEDDIMNIAGATEELFGENSTATSGFMMQLRMGAGLVSLQNVFDRLRLSQKRLGNLFIKMIQENWGSGKVRRILNEDPTAQFNNKNFQKYDCVVEEGILTSTQKQMQFVQLLQLREMGLPISSEILIEASTLQKKDELIAAIQQVEEQQQAVQQQQQQQELEQQLLVTRSIEAKAQNDFAGAQERQGRTISNIGLYSERESEKAQNMASASLDMARAMKELQEMDLSRVGNALNLLMQIQQMQKISDRDVDAQGVQVADFVGKDVDIANKETALPKKQPQQEQEQNQALSEASPV